MEKVKLVFIGSELSETQEHELMCYHNTQDEIYISIDHGDYPPSFICLNKATAVKLSKELKKQIGYING